MASYLWAVPKWASDAEDYAAKASVASVPDELCHSFRGKLLASLVQHDHKIVVVQHFQDPLA